jgi:hypothetical protein
LWTRIKTKQNKRKGFFLQSLLKSVRMRILLLTTFIYFWNCWSFRICSSRSGRFNWDAIISASLNCLFRRKRSAFATGSETSRISWSASLFAPLSIQSSANGYRHIKQKKHQPTKKQSSPKEDVSYLKADGILFLQCNGMDLLIKLSPFLRRNVL